MARLVVQKVELVGVPVQVHRQGEEGPPVHAHLCAPPDCLEGRHAKTLESNEEDSIREQLSRRDETRVPFFVMEEPQGPQGALELGRVFYSLQEGAEEGVGHRGMPGAAGEAGEFQY